MGEIFNQSSVETGNILVQLRYDAILHYYQKGRQIFKIDISVQRHFRYMLHLDWNQSRRIKRFDSIEIKILSIQAYLIIDDFDYLQMRKQVKQQLTREISQI